MMIGIIRGIMFKPLQVYIGLRYTRAKRRNHFISFISLTSITGVALGVAALITVLSVMNGFEKELRERILGVTSHATVVAQGGKLVEWGELVNQLEGHYDIIGAAPFIRAEGMLTHRGAVNGSFIRGVLPDQESKVSVVGEQMLVGSLHSLRPGEWNVILGKELAATLHATMGDRITIVAPQPSTSPAGIIPRLKRFTVSGIFEIGMNEYDSALALMHMEEAAHLFKFDAAVTGVRLQTKDPYRALLLPNVLAGELPPGLVTFDWSYYHQNFYRALKTEKMVMFVILALIVAVAAFNIVSTLVMVVTDKRAEVAILRTLGMPPGDVMTIFIVQGTLIGVAGVMLGMLGGVALASNIEAIVKFIELQFDYDFLPPSVYYISDLPSDMRWAEVIRISVIAFFLCVAATLYPAWQAARTQPAEALRYE